MAQATSGTDAHQTVAQDVGIEPLVREYLRLIQEGWEPDLEEYLSRVPEELREQVCQGIDQALANPPEQPVEELPAEEAGLLVDDSEGLFADDPGTATEVALDVLAAQDSPDDEPSTATELQLDTARDAADEVPLVPEGAELIEEPAPEPASPPARPVRPRLTEGPPGVCDHFVQPISRLVPKDMREQFAGELQELLWHHRVWGEFWPERVIGLIRFVARGLAQFAPLQYVPEEDAEAPLEDPAWLWGASFAWRISGAAMLAGFLFGHPPLMISGALLLAIAFAGLVISVRRPIRTARETRHLNSLMGGTIAVFAGGILPGLYVLASLGLAAWGPGSSLVGGAVQGLITVLLVVLFFVSATGWSPEPWRDQALVRVQSFERRRVKF